MDTANDNVSTAYTTGFNEGYILAKFKPELFESIQSSILDSQSDRGRGLLDGGRQFEFEKEPVKYPSWMKSLDELEQTQPTPDKSLNKDDLEPEL